MTHPNTPEAARRRVAWHRAGQQIDALREDQALNNTLGQGIGYGFAAADAELAPEFVALRLAGGLRWAGATRAAVVALNTCQGTALSVPDSVRAVPLLGCDHLP